MTDPTQPPVNPQTPPPAAPPPYQQSGYAAAPAYNGGPAASTAVPGRTLGIVALVLAIVPVGLQLIGLILGNGNDRGLIGITFKLSGPFDKPNLTINPLSIIAPGVFRNIFEFQ